MSEARDDDEPTDPGSMRGIGHRLEQMHTSLDLFSKLLDAQGRSLNKLVANEEAMGKALHDARNYLHGLMEAFHRLSAVYEQLIKEKENADHPKSDQEST